MQAVYALSTDAEAAASADYMLTKLVEVHGIIDDVMINKADWGFLLFMDSDCIVFSQYGELLCHFIDGKAHVQPSLAFLPSNRIALAHQDGFAIWHLSSSNLLATITPQPGSPAGTGGLAASGVVAADQTGPKLAWCGGASPACVQQHKP